MDAKLAHAIADGFSIAEVARLRLPQANPDAGLGNFIAQVIQPFRERFAAIITLIPQQFYHRFMVA